MKTLLKKAMSPLKRTLRACIPPGMILYRVKTDAPTLYLTFDDGPHPQNTPVILDVLKEYGGQATFFLLGKEAEAAPHLVTRIAEEGHALGSHTHTHCDLSKTNPEAVKHELEESIAAIEAPSVTQVSLFRPPWGKLNWGSFRTLRKRKMTIVLWSVDSLDFQIADARQILARLRSMTLQPGDILLFHDDYSHTVELMPELLQYLKDQGWQCRALPTSHPQRPRTSPRESALLL